MTNQETVHALIFGDSGAGKSTGASTFPRPMLVCCFDPLGKDMPYWRGVHTQALVEAQDIETDELGTRVRRCVSKKSGKLLIQIEYYNDADPEKPEAYARFRRRMAGFRADEYAVWKTVVLDSITFMELAARKHEQYVLNPRAKDPRQWFGGSTDALEEMLMQRFGSMPLNVVLIAHVDEEKDEVHGTFLRNPKAPGRLRKGLSSAFGEFYRAFRRRLDDGTYEYVWQTRSDNMWNSASQIGAPDPCVQHYSQLWNGGDTP